MSWSQLARFRNTGTVRSEVENTKQNSIINFPLLDQDPILTGLAREGLQFEGKGKHFRETEEQREAGNTHINTTRCAPHPLDTYNSGNTRNHAVAATTAADKDNVDFPP